MELVTVFTPPESIFGDDFLSTVRAGQVKDLVVVEDNLDIATNLEKLSLR